MASVRTTFTLDDGLASQARKLNINISAAARRGVTDAVKQAMIASDREAYMRHPEQPDAFWDAAQAWTDE